MADREDAYEIKNEQSENSDLQGRRRVLKGTGLGSALAILPSKSVWATSSGLAGSVMASNHASAFAEAASYQLISPNEWKVIIDGSQLDVSGNFDDQYGRIFIPLNALGGVHVTSLAKEFYDRIDGGVLFKITLPMILGNSIAIAKFFNNTKTDVFVLKGSEPITDDDLTLGEEEIDNFVVSYSWNDTAVSKSIGVIKAELAGLDQINRYMVSAYLNAKHHHTGLFPGRIYFPVSGKHNQRSMAYANAEEFAKDMHMKYGHKLMLRQLVELHNNPRNFHNIV